MISRIDRTVRLLTVVVLIVFGATFVARAQSNFEILDDTDLPGYDYGPIQRQSYPECLSACDGDRNCRAFTFNKAKLACFLKRDAGTPKNFDGAISGVKLNQEATSQEGSKSTARFEILQEADLPGGDYRTIRDVDLGHCRDACAADNDCVAFTQNYKKNVCFLKNRASTPLHFEGAISARKNGAVAAVADTGPTGGSTDGFAIYSDTDLPGGDGALINEKAGSLEACRLQCLFNDGCDAFTYNHGANICLGKAKAFVGGAAMVPTPFKNATSGVKLSPALVANARKDYIESGPKVPMADLAWRDGDSAASFVSRVRSAAKPLGADCTLERALMNKIAGSVSVKLPRDVRMVGTTLPLDWTATPVAKAPPLWLMVSTSGATRFKAQGFYALAPNAIAPFGISVDADRTRLLTTLFGRDALAEGKIEIAPLQAGDLTVSVRAVGYLRACGEEFLRDIEAVTISVSPSTIPVFQVRDPFSFDVPKAVWMSPNGHAKLEAFDDRFRLVDTDSGAFLADREGKNPSFSPTGRFVMFEVDDELEFIDAVDGASVGKADGIVGWENQDSFVVVGGFGYGAVTAFDFLVGNAKIGGAPGCRICQGRAESYVLDLENDVVHDGSGRYAQRLSGLRKSSAIAGGDQNAHVRFIAEQTGAAPAFMPSSWILRGGLEFAPYEPWTAAGSGELDSWQKEEAAHMFVAQKIPNGGQGISAGLQPLSIGRWRGAMPLQKPKSRLGAIRERLAEIGLSFTDDQSPRYRNHDAHAQSAEIAKRIAKENHAVARLFVPLENRAGCEVDPEIPNADEKILAEFSQAVEYQLGDRPIWLTMLTCQEGSAGFYHPGFLLFDSKLKRGFVPIDGDNPNTDIGTVCQGDISYCEFQSRLYRDRYLLIWSKKSRGIMVFDLERRKTIFKEFNLGRGDILKEVFYSVDDQHVTQVNMDGSFYVYDALNGAHVMEGRYVDDEAIAWTPDLHFDASPEGANYVNLRFPGQNGQYAFQQFASMVKRPGLVREVLERRYKAGSEPLPVPPRLAGDVRMKEDRIVGSVTAVGAKAIRIYQDGLLTDLIDVEQSPAEISVDIAHSSGSRWVSLVAYSQSGVASLPVGEDVVGEMANKPTIHVLAVGVDTYVGKGLQHLAFASRDAKTLLRAISSENGKSLTLGMAFTLTDEKATPSLILAKVHEVVAAAKTGDTVVFSFAGHGVTGPDGRFFLATSNTDANNIAETALAWETLASVLAKSSARVLVFLDACHSGAAGTSMFATNDDAAEEVLDGGPAGLLVFSASKGRQFSEESSEAGGGLFSNAVAAVISRDRKDYDLDRNGAIEISELYAGVKRKVTDQSSGRQVPWLARNALVGDFAIF